MSDMNLRDTIAPKSDQLNADDLLGTTMTIKVTDVTRGSADQPVSIHYEGDKGRPYKPCKSMRRVLIYCWSDDGKSWIGKSMTLYTDPEVKFGGVKVGGIRISHVSDIEQPQLMQLTATRGKRAAYKVQPLVVELAPYPADAFEESSTKWKELIESGEKTAEQIINACARRGYSLSDDQIKELKQAKAA